MLKTMDANGIPARIIVSNVAPFLDFHRLLVDFDFDWKAKGSIDKYNRIKDSLMRYHLEGILVKTSGGCHFISSRAMSFDNARRLCRYLSSDPRYLGYAEKEGYFSLRVSQKYQKRDLYVDSHYEYHDEQLRQEYEALVETYKNYHIYKDPVKLAKFLFSRLKSRYSKKGGLLDSYRERVLGENDTSASTPLYHTSYR